MAMVLGGHVVPLARGKLPRWTGAAPPEASEATTEVTSAPATPPAEGRRERDRELEREREREREVNTAAGPAAPTTTATAPELVAKAGPANCRAGVPEYTAAR